MTFDYTEFNTIMYLFLVQSAHRSHKVLLSVHVVRS